MDRAKQFFRKHQSCEDRRAKFDKLKQKLPCARCGQLGHWKDDNDCPAKVKVVNWEETEEQDTEELHPFPVTTHGRERCATTSGVIDTACALTRLLWKWCPTMKHFDLEQSRRVLVQLFSRLQWDRTCSFWPRPQHRQRTLLITKLTQRTVKLMSPVVTFTPQVRGTTWHTEFTGDLVLVNCCPFEGGDVGQSMNCHEGDVSSMVSGSPGFGERSTRSEVRRVEASNRQQTKAIVVQGQGRTRDSGTAPSGSAGTPTRGGRTSVRAKETAPTWSEEVPSRRDQGTGRGTEYPNLWTRRQAQVKEALIRDLLRWCEKQTENDNGAVRGVCRGRADRRDGRVGTEQSGSFGILEEKNDLPNPVSNVGTRRRMALARGRNNRHRIERQASLTTHGTWTKATFGRAAPANFGQ